MNDARPEVEAHDGAQLGHGNLAKVEHALLEAGGHLLGAAKELANKRGGIRPCDPPETTTYVAIQPNFVRLFSFS